MALFLLGYLLPELTFLKLGLLMLIDKAAIARAEISRAENIETYRPIDNFTGDVLAGPHLLEPRLLKPRLLKPRLLKLDLPEPNCWNYEIRNRWNRKCYSWNFQI